MEIHLDGGQLYTVFFLSSAFILSCLSSSFFLKQWIKYSKLHMGVYVNVNIISAFQTKFRHSFLFGPMQPVHLKIFKRNIFCACRSERAVSKIFYFRRFCPLPLTPPPLRKENRCISRFFFVSFLSNLLKQSNICNKCSSNVGSLCLHKINTLLINFSMDNKNKLY